MDKLLIRGGRPLQGEVLISGAKKAALPELCATLRNVPRLQEVSTMLTRIRNMGVQVVQVNAGTRSSPEVPCERAKTRHVNELVRPGANIQIDGAAKLSGATVMDRACHLDRGYDQMETKLCGIGADIERLT